MGDERTRDEKLKEEKQKNRRFLCPTKALVIFLYEVVVTILLSTEYLT